jgi:hypothetical protein
MSGLAQQGNRNMSRRMDIEAIKQAANNYLDGLITVDEFFLRFVSECDVDILDEAFFDLLAQFVSGYKSNE